MTSNSTLPRFVSSYLGAVCASTLAATAGLALFGFVIRGGGNVAELPVVLWFALLYSAIGVAVLGPLGFVVLQRLQQQGDGAYLLIGAVLGALGGAAMSGFDWELGMPFAVAGGLAGAAGAFGFRRIFHPSTGSAR